MEFFGKIGIDGRLLFAQAINFAVLVWFLNRFAYRPMLKGMESGGLELAEKQAEKNRLESEKIRLDRDAALREVKKKSAAVVSEAQHIATQIKERTTAETLKEKEEILGQAREQARLQDAASAVALSRAAKAQVVSEMTERLGGRVADKAAAAAMQVAYFESLLSAISSLRVEVPSHFDGAVPFAYASAPEKEQKKRLEKLLQEKLGRKDLSIGGKREPSLLAGFRLEIAGIVIDENLLTDIRHAVNID